MAISLYCQKDLECVEVGSNKTRDDRAQPALDWWVWSQNKEEPGRNTCRFQVFLSKTILEKLANDAVVAAAVVVVVENMQPGGGGGGGPDISDELPR